MGEPTGFRDTVLSSMARGATAQVLRGVDAGVADARNSLSRTAEAAGRRVVARVFGIAFALTASGWGSFALYKALGKDLPNWGAALIVAGGFALASLIVWNLPPSRAARQARRPQTNGDRYHDDANP